MFKTIINAWKVPEVRKRLLFTILLLIIFRFGTHVSVPFVNFARLDGVMNTANNGLLGMINLITGGAFARLSVFAMSISPYISASIIVQLLGMLLPSLEMMMKEGGEQGKQKINRYTKIITFILALDLYLGITSSAGQINVQNMITAIAIMIGVMVLIIAVVYVHIAERKIPVQYSRKIVGRKMYGGQNTFIPIKPVMAGVMPIIFASSFMAFPAMIIQIFFSGQIGTGSFADWLYSISVATSLSNANIWALVGHAVLYMILIVGFTFFYTLAVFNPAEIAMNIRQNGGYIPGIRAGKPTTDFLSNVVIKLTGFGALFLCFIAIAPILANAFTSISIGFGGTSILIIVGVAIETVQQLESQLMLKHYKGFLE